MKNDTKAVLPVIAVLVIIGAFLLIGFMVVAFLTLKMILAVALVGGGLYLLVKQDKLAGMTGNMRILVPLALIVIGVIVYVY